jgi:MoaA/NifB/PqqE/SkfB family radical SAM enzyme
MNSPVFLTGWPKWRFYLRLMIHIFLRYAGEVFQGKIALWAFFRLIFRLLLLLRVLLENKVVQIGTRYKLQLYLPAYPSAAFWESINKFVRPDPGPLTVVFSMTRACGYKCPHCYQRNDSGADLEMPALKNVAREMQEIGVTMFDIEGGEPLLKFDRLLDLLTAFDDKREIWLNTTGHLLTPERARQLKEAGVFGVMMSLHAPTAAEHDGFTGFPGSFDIVRTAADLFGTVGITVVLNCCPSPELTAGDGIERIMQTARDWHCSFVQIIHGKSAGAWLGKDDEMIRARNMILRLQATHRAFNSPGRYEDYPSASVQVFEEAEEHLGCTAGGIDRFYLNADGEVQPCEFLNVSFGNIREESFRAIFARMRRYFRTPGTRWLCSEEAPSIYHTLRANGLQTTPLPWRLTKKLVPTWKRGKPTPLYRRMGLYRRSS